MTDDLVCGLRLRRLPDRVDTRMGEQATITATRKPKTRLKRVHLCDSKGCRHDAAYIVITCYPGTGKKATYRRYCATHVPREEKET